MERTYYLPYRTGGFNENTGKGVRTFNCSQKHFLFVFKGEQRWGRGLALAEGTFLEEVIMSQDGVGVQTKSPQDVPLWCVGCELGQPRHHKLNETSAPPTLNHLEEFEFKVLPRKLR